MSTIDHMKLLLSQSFSPVRLEIQDLSEHHKGHKEAIESGGGHYSILVVSEDFQKKSRIERHRMIFYALMSIKDKIHAVGIKALTTEEYKSHVRNL